ncbi:di-heme enzyme [Leptospira bourretii]|uniref:Di-heme enzyme n=1 Tax=Leptospira bourretii TaxID=2484962 RepID=A0A4V3JLG7_9LEPT|nr:MbnH family di-heme enzyme [Leptospira bourretii]TGK89379.1 di-heme enzyme [Leptospira bourretii]TGK93453.1 di-heme enzyme [Leptospira bourretii]TGL18386.1 di-heme enzyme [Leptospira bourretii]TGL39923.1 di-heme enzyme [Leptospira bourretii]
MKYFHFPLFVLFVFLFGCNIFPFQKKENNDDMLLAALGILATASDWVWDLPPGFPVPNVPSDNPMSKAKVELGRFLFYEKKLSGNGTMACSSCHFQSLAFADGKDFPSGITNQAHPRNAQHLSNVAYMPRLTWSNPKMTSLELQARAPMFGESPVELGLQNNNFLNELSSNVIYPPMFERAFGGSGINEQNVRYALASFQRSMISGNSRYDQYTFRNNRSALTASEVRGLNLFNGETAECFHCHGGFNFTDTSFHGGATEEFFYHSNGIHTDAYYAGLPSNKRGLFDLTGVASDTGKFRAPSLRNIGVTYPYMHDGIFMCADANNPDKAAGAAAGKTKIDCARDALTQVVDHYRSGGQAHSGKDGALIRPFTISDSQRDDMVNFLLALTDDEFLTNPKFASPF